MTSTMESQRESASKAMFTVIGAPVVAGRKLKVLSFKVVGDLAEQTTEWEEEGRKLTGQFQDSKVVEQMQEQVQKVDYEQLQGQVEKLRDQLETVLANWRVGFRPDEPEVVEKPKKKATTKKAATTPKTEEE